MAITPDGPHIRRDLTGYGASPPAVVWPEGSALALNLVACYEEGAEYGRGWGEDRNEGGNELGVPIDAEFRDLATESVYEYGARAGIWRLLRLLDEYECKATFFVSAAAVELNPAVGAAIRQAGHEPHGHGYRWIEHWRLTEEEERAQIARAVASVEQTCGTRPVGWYVRYGPSVHTRELVVQEGGFVYDSMDYSDDLPYFVQVRGKRHLVIPYTFTYNDARYIYPQGFGSPCQFVDVCKRAIDEYRREGRAGFPKMMSIGTHARYTGQAGRLSGLREVLEYALGRGDVWITTRGAIADWWLAHHEEFTR
jgi:peptidoglycan/xylan/chitin deacetylase (PgdA/CDA1 family)